MPVQTETRRAQQEPSRAIPYELTRRHRLNPPKSWRARLLISFKNGFEGLIARSSVHGDPPVYDVREFPWAGEVEREWRTIRAEAERVMQRRSELASFHEISRQVESITRDDQWKTFFLAGMGMDIEENCRLCPETSRIIKKIPGIKTAFFSILSPRKHIPPHRGPYAGILRYHLGLIVPEPAERCRIRIADETHHWREGESLFFDDTFNHEVWNDTDGYRVILFVDFVRPLRFPMNLINGVILDLAARSQLLTEARDNQRKWERTFYGTKRQHNPGA